MIIKRLVSAFTGAAMLMSTAALFSGCTAEEFFNGSSSSTDSPEKSVSDSGSVSQQLTPVVQDLSRVSAEDAVSDGVMTNEEWLKLINDYFGMPVDENAENGELEAAKDWDIVGENEEIDSQQPVSNDFAVKSLMRAAGYVSSDASDDEVIQAAKEVGIINDSYDDIGDVSNLPDKLEAARDSWCNQKFEQKTDIELAENVVDMTEDINVTDIKMDDDSIDIPSGLAGNLETDSVFILPKEAGGGKGGAYKVISIKDNGDGTSSIKSVPASIAEVYRSCKISGSYGVDGSSVGAVGDGVEVAFDSGSVEGLSNSDEEGGVRQLSFEEEEPKLQQLSETGANIEFTTDLDENTEVTVAIKNISLDTYIDWNIDWDWFNSKLNVNKIYAALNYDTEISLDSKFEFEEKLFEKGDLEDLIIAKKSLSQPSLEIGKFAIYICPGFSVNFRVNLILEASGEMKVSVTTNNVKGIEMKGSNIRAINDTNASLEVEMNGKIGAYAALTLALSLDYIVDEADLVNITLKVGPTLEAGMKYHEDIGKDEEGILCADISSYIQVEVKVNFPKLITDMLDVESYITLVDEKFLESNFHMENFKMVGSCTVDGEETTEEETTEGKVENSGILEIDTSYKSLSVGDSFKLELKSIPSGYSSDDIVWTSSDESKISVDNGGNVIANSVGAASITASTSDGKYSVTCTINATDISQTANHNGLILFEDDDLIAA